jgi:molybdopterin molybdotransferase
VLLGVGASLGPPQLAVAASVGASIVSVYARPTVAVLSTGDELVDIDQTPTGSQIRNSNSIMLVALLRQLGCDVRKVAHVRDTMSDVLDAITTNLNGDAMFITGGMSMGEFDFVPKALQQLGATFEISKLRIKPGKPFVYARLRRSPEPALRYSEEPDAMVTPDPGVRTTSDTGLGGECHVFGLPGNPVSAYVCTVRLAARILSRIAGGPPEGNIVNAALTMPLPANGPREFYLPAVLSGNQVTPLNPNGSADIFTLAKANALVMRSENAAAAKAGDGVPVFNLSFGDAR